MSIILYILLSIALLIFLSGGYVFLVGCVRRKELPWFNEEKLKNTTYGRFYGNIIEADQWLRENHAQDVTMQSHDGLTLHAWWIPADNPKGTVLLAHGYRSTPLVDFGLAFPFYHRIGMNILVPAQRSHGKSEGRYITFGVKESRDFLDWVKYHNKKFGNYPVILSGMSMGASTVMFMADLDLPENVRGIIADCGFSSPKEILSSVYTKVTHLPAGPSLWAAEWFARVFGKFSLTEKNTRKTLAKNKLPILMVHGAQDDFVPCQMTRDGFSACAGKKELLIVEGAEHGVSFLVDPDGYGNALIRFFKENMEENP